MRLPALNESEASTRRNPHSSSSSLLANGVRVAWTDPLISALRPAQSYALPHASFASVPATLKTHFLSSRRQISQIPLGWPPGHLSSVIRKFPVRARIAAQGGKSFAIHLASDATVWRRRWLAMPKRRIHCYQSDASIPPGPATPFLRNQLNGIIGDIEGYELQDNAVVLKHFNGGDNRRRVLLPKHVDDRSSRLRIYLFRQENTSCASQGNEMHRSADLTYQQKGVERVQNHLLGHPPCHLRDHRPAGASCILH